MNNQDNFLPHPSALYLYPQQRRTVYQINPDTIYIKKTIERNLGRTLTDFHIYKAYAVPLLPEYVFISWFDSAEDIETPFDHSSSISFSTSYHSTAINNEKTTYNFDFPVIKKEFNNLVQETMIDFANPDNAITLTELFVKCAMTTLLHHNTIILDSIPDYEEYYTEVLKQLTPVMTEWKDFNSKYSSLPHVIIEKQMTKVLNMEIERGFHIQKRLSRLYKPGIRVKRVKDLFIVNLYTYTPAEERVLKWEMRIHFNGSIVSSVRDCSFFWRLLLG